MKDIKLPYKLLVYDVETALLLAWLFALGEQRVNHSQLLESSDMFQILTISYKWYGEKEVHVLEGETALEDFDKIARTADVIIGKNNFRFDDKRINTDRMLKGLPPFPNWAARSDDLESQLRKYFAFPSYSLDAISKHLGFGGKEKMEFNDWVSIAKYQLLEKFKLTLASRRVNSKYLIDASYSFCMTMFHESSSIVTAKGKTALKKMGHYNGKDVLDTEAILKRILPYIQIKHNAGNEVKGVLACKLCGSHEVTPTQIITAGTTKYQEFHCKSHNGYGGRATFKWDKQRHKSFGRVQ